MKISKWREQENITIKEAAGIIGVPFTTYRHWEYGDRVPTVDNMKKVVENTNGKVQPGDFYG